MKTTPQLLVMGLASLLCASALAEVKETRENSFSIESSVDTTASPALVYKALGNVGEWWDSEHTWSGSARNLSLDLQAGGCFCEKLPDGGSVQHGRVVYTQPGVMVRLDAPLGPMQEMPATGILTFKLTPEGSGTRIIMTYRVSGAFTLESAKLAPIVDSVMNIQLGRLKVYADKSVGSK